MAMNVIARKASKPFGSDILTPRHPSGLGIKSFPKAIGADRQT
jgi:hypothetical protein